MFQIIITKCSKICNNTFSQLLSKAKDEYISNQAVCVNLWILLFHPEAWANPDNPSECISTLELDILCVLMTLPLTVCLENWLAVYLRKRDETSMPWAVGFSESVIFPLCSQSWALTERQCWRGVTFMIDNVSLWVRHMAKPFNLVLWCLIFGQSLLFNFIYFIWINHVIFDKSCFLTINVTLVSKIIKWLKKTHILSWKGAISKCAIFLVLKKWSGAWAPSAEGAQLQLCSWGNWRGNPYLRGQRLNTAKYEGWPCKLAFWSIHCKQPTCNLTVLTSLHENIKMLTGQKVSLLITEYQKNACRY